MIPVINLLAGIVFFGILTFETGLRNNTGKEIHDNYIQLITEPVFQLENYDNKFLKNKTQSYLYSGIADDDLLSDSNTFTSVTGKLSICNYFKHNNFHNNLPFYLLPSELDLPPPF